jgi:DNA repair protein RadC
MTIQTLFGTEKISNKSKVKIRQIKSVFQTVTVKEKVTSYLDLETRYTDPAQVFSLFSFLQQETKEYFIALHLDGKNRIVCFDIVSVGSLNQSIVHPRELFKTALLSSAAALILVHNHPTGDPLPSTQDIQITKRLKEAGEIIGISILDHIICGSSYYSFVSNGLM